MKYCDKSRRMFLQGAGRTLLAVPFLPSLLPKYAYANVAGLPIYIQIGMNSGPERVQAWPIANTVPLINTERYTHTQDLAQIIAAEGQMCGMFDASWNQYASKMNIFTNITLYRNQALHNAWSNFTCKTYDYADRVIAAAFKAYSVDDLIHRSWIKKGYNPALPVIRTSIDNTKGSYNPYSWGLNGGQKHNDITSIAALENLVFQNASGSTSPPQSSGADPKIKMVDAVIEDYRRIMASKKLSKVDRDRFQQTMDLWNDIGNKRRQQLASQGQGGSNSCSVPTHRSTVTQSEKYNYATDLLFAAIQCGLTKVVTQNLYAFGDQYLNIMDRTPSERLHEATHHASVPPNNGRDIQPDDWKDQQKVRSWTKPNPMAMDGFKWRFGFIKNWMRKLEGAVDANGQPLMNNAIIFSTTEYATGHHTNYARTAWTFGDAGGKLKTGLHVNGGGAPVQKLHTTVMRALGLTQSEIEIEGGPGFGDYNGSGWSDPHRELTVHKMYSAANYAKLFYRNDFSRFPFFNTAAERRKPFVL